MEQGPQTFVYEKDDHVREANIKFGEVDDTTRLGPQRPELNNFSFMCKEAKFSATAETVWHSSRR